MDISAQILTTGAASAAVQHQMLPLSVIRTDGGAQMRAELHQATVEEYTEAMRAGVPFPAIEVYYDGESYWLADGFHRVAAWRTILPHDEPVAATVRAGTRRDAILHAARANAGHGLRRTNADKRRAVETLLRDAEWAQWSDRKIADACAVSNQFVSNLRQELSVNGGQMPTERLVQRGDATFVMDTSKIGQGPAQRPAIHELETAIAAWLQNSTWTPGSRWPAMRYSTLVGLVEYKHHHDSWEPMWGRLPEGAVKKDVIQALNNLLEQVRQGQHGSWIEPEPKLEQPAGQPPVLDWPKELAAAGFRIQPASNRAHRNIIGVVLHRHQTSYGYFGSQETAEGHARQILAQETQTESGLEAAIHAWLGQHMATVDTGDTNPLSVRATIMQMLSEHSYSENRAELENHIAAAGLSYTDNELRQAIANVTRQAEREQQEDARRCWPELTQQTGWEAGAVSLNRDWTAAEIEEYAAANEVRVVAPVEAKDDPTPADLRAVDITIEPYGNRWRWRRSLPAGGVEYGLSRATPEAVIAEVRETKRLITPTGAARGAVSATLNELPVVESAGTPVHVPPLNLDKARAARRENLLHLHDLFIEMLGSREDYENLTGDFDVRRWRALRDEIVPMIETLQRHLDPTGKRELSDYWPKLDDVPDGEDVFAQHPVHEQPTEAQP